MKLKIVTNNRKLYEFGVAEGFDTEFMDVPLKELMYHCRDMVMQGWTLVTDPLMGYKHRPNPFHSVILAEAEDDSRMGEDVMRLEQCVVVREERGHEIDLVDPSRDGFIELDYSLAKNAMLGALKFYEK